MKKRVVVTGLGMVTPLGLDVASTWANVLAGQSGVKPITHFDASSYRAQIAATVEGFDPTLYLPAKEARRYDTFVQYGVAAAIQAMQQAGLTEETLPQLNTKRIGVCIGSGIGGLPMIEDNHTTLMQQGARRISPFFVPGSIINMTAGLLAIRFGLRGPNLATATACTTSTHAIGLAARLIAYGDVDVMVAGVAKNPRVVWALAAFRRCKPSRPATMNRPVPAVRLISIAMVLCSVMGRAR
jgi:3-oxoacyl-[acyl-carrier-protein] synthase II